MTIRKNPSFESALVTQMTERIETVPHMDDEYEDEILLYDFVLWIGESWRLATRTYVDKASLEAAEHQAGYKIIFDSYAESEAAARSQFNAWVGLKMMGLFT